MSPEPPFVGAYPTMFLSGRGRPTGMSGPGWIGIDAAGLRVVGSRTRVDAAFYGAFAFLVGGVAIALSTVLCFSLRRPLLYAAIVGPILLSSVVHRLLLRVLRPYAEDRIVPFERATCWGVGTAGFAVSSADDGFVGTTWVAFVGGERERQRFFDEYVAARTGGARAYRDAHLRRGDVPSVA